MRSQCVVLALLLVLACLAQVESNEQATTPANAKLVSLIRKTWAQRRAEKRKKQAARRAARKAYWARRRAERQRKQEARRKYWEEKRRRRREKREKARLRKLNKNKNKNNNKGTKPTKPKTPPPSTVPPPKVPPSTVAPVTAKPPTVPPTSAPPPTVPPPTKTVTTASGSGPPAKSSRNPCHANRRFQGDGQQTCLKYFLPKGLCTACPLRPFSFSGFFKNCGRIYDLTSNACRQQLTKYTEMNPCDKQRKKLVADFDNPANEMGLDYFVYSICEMCCDCVPMGTQKGSFAKLQKEGKLMKVDRANCPAHAVADICKVWPNVRAVYSEADKNNGKFESDATLKKEPKVCDGMRIWKNKQGQLYKVPEIGINGGMRTFMTDFVDAANCRDPGFWNECVALETSQRRI